MISYVSVSEVVVTGQGNSRLHKETSQGNEWNLSKSRFVDGIARGRCRNFDGEEREERLSGWREKETRGGPREERRET